MINIKYPLDLQFFSAESEGRTEEATAKKKEDARKKGQVAKSTELNTAVLIVGFCGISLGLGGYMLSGIKESLVVGIKRISENLNTTTENIVTAMGDAILEIIIICAPLWGALCVLAFLITYIQVGYKVSFEPMKVKFNKMNPVNGIKRIVSKDMIVSLLLSVGKVVVLGSIMYQLIISEIPIYINFYEHSASETLETIAGTVIKMGFFVGGAFLVLAVLDYVYQRYKHSESIKMTKQEVKE